MATPGTPSSAGWETPARHSEITGQRGRRGPCARSLKLHLVGLLHASSSILARAALDPDPDRHCSATLASRIRGPGRVGEAAAQLGLVAVAYVGPVDQDASRVDDVQAQHQGSTTSSCRCRSARGLGTSPARRSRPRSPGQASWAHSRSGLLRTTPWRRAPAPSQSRTASSWASTLHPRPRSRRSPSAPSEAGSARARGRRGHTCTPAPPGTRGASGGRVRRTPPSLLGGAERVDRSDVAEQVRGHRNQATGLVARRPVGRTISTATCTSASASAPKDPCDRRTAGRTGR